MTQSPHRTNEAETSSPPDIVAVHVLPWWILLGAFALCVGLAWLLRGVWWSKWIMFGLTVVFTLFLSSKRRRSPATALARMLWMVAVISEFLVMAMQRIYMNRRFALQFAQPHSHAGVNTKEFLKAQSNAGKILFDANKVRRRAP